MKYPTERTSDAGQYVAGYVDSLQAAYASIDRSAVARAAQLILDTIWADRLIYSCGNGGSAAIANHLCCDFAKGIRTGTTLRPRVVSLAATIELITAIGNDIDYADIFVHQLQSIARPGDLLIAVSSSGDSENIVRAVSWAKQNEVGVIGLSGFSGARLRALAQISIHVDGQNYGIVEDTHQSIMHMLAQYLRQSALDGTLTTVTF
jgi:D-sedoheptulose 7-phosphate isomerase